MDAATLKAIYERDDQLAATGARLTALENKILLLEGRIVGISRDLDPGMFGSFANTLNGALDNIREQLATLLNRPTADATAITEANKQLTEHTAPLAAAVESIGGTKQNG